MGCICSQNTSLHLYEGVPSLGAAGQKMHQTALKVNGQAADPVLHPIIMNFTVDCGNSPIITYDSGKNDIQCLKAGFDFNAYQTFFAQGHLYAFKNGENFHVQLHENMAATGDGAIPPSKRHFNPSSEIEYSGFALCHDERFIYVTGGYKEVVAADPTTNEACKFELGNLSAHTPLMPMQCGRTGHSAAICAEQIFAFAGYSQTGLDDSIECKSLTDDKARWQLLLETKLPSPRQFFVVCPVGPTSILIAGGASSQDQHMLLFEMPTTREKATIRKLADTPISFQNNGNNLAVVEKPGESVIAYASVQGKGECIIRLNWSSQNKEVVTILNTVDLRTV